MQPGHRHAAPLHAGTAGPSRPQQAIRHGATGRVEHQRGRIGQPRGVLDSVPADQAHAERSVDSDCKQVLCRERRAEIVECLRVAPLRAIDTPGLREYEGIVEHEL